MQTRPSLPAPVLVTGAPRSGTTWVGRMLALSGELGEIYEPFNPGAHQARWFRPEHFYLYVDERSSDTYARDVADMAAFRFPLARHLVRARTPEDLRATVRTWRLAARRRRAGQAPLVKDPMALFAAPWLAGGFGFRPVVVVRHPAAFVGAILRVGWQVRFESWLRQDRLMATLLAPHADDITAAQRAPRDLVRDAALFWRVTQSVVLGYRAEHPDWSVARHEDLAADPTGSFRELYDGLELRWSAVVAEAVAAATGTHNVAAAESGVQHVLARDSRAVTQLWRQQLTGAQVETVREITAGVAEEFYPASSWQ